LPKSVLEQWQTELARLPLEQQTLERRKRIEEALDQGRGACVLARPELAAIVKEALRHFDGSRYRLYAWVIMPNHVHALITPLKDHSLSDILHSWKSHTAKQINKQLGQTGQFWQEEYYDRMIRDETHYAAVVDYIENNPVKAGLCAKPADWIFSSAFRGDQDQQRAGQNSYGGGELRAGRPRSQDDDDDTPLDAGGTGARAYAEAVSVYLGLGVDRQANRTSTICFWDTKGENIQQVFARQALPMTWDFTESNPLGDATGGFIGQIDGLSRVAAKTLAVTAAGVVNQHDSQTQTISTNKFVSTDPPYYDNIGYADLSDFFYVWLRRSLRLVYPNLFATVSTPKAEELVATPYRHGNREKAEKFFLDGMTQAMHNLAVQAHPAAPITIYYAFKQSESGTAGVPPASSKGAGVTPASSISGQDGRGPSGPSETNNTGWETFLEAVFKSGLSVTGTWPMRTELTGNLKKTTNALASSIILVCRPRAKDAGTISRRQFVRMLNETLPLALDAMTRGPSVDIPGTAGVPPASSKGGQDGRGPSVDIPGTAGVPPASSKGGQDGRGPSGPSTSIPSTPSPVSPVDLSQAIIGPGMAIFSRYEAVLEADGTPMSVKTALQLINRFLAEDDFDADTQFCLHWFEQHGWETGKFGEADTLARAKGTSVDGVKAAGVIEAGGGKVRLLRWRELDPTWDPAKDSRIPVWQVLHQMILSYNKQGDSGAAKLYAALLAKIEAARQLAYRLYTLCERKGWAEDARAYNELVTGWSGIESAAASKVPSSVQQTLFD
jgi:putative DNA methylase